MSVSPSLSGVQSIHELPRDTTDTCPSVSLTLDAKRDSYRRIRAARAEGEKAIPAEFITLSKFTRPIRFNNRISLQRRINNIGYTGQAEGAFCVFDEHSQTLTAVAGNHRTLAVLALDLPVRMYVMHINLSEEEITLSQIAFTVEQFFRGTQN